MSDKIYTRASKDKELQEELSRGIVKEITIMFADIRGFTRRTETMPPEQIVTLLDLFMPEMLHIIMERHKGMVDKLLGDGIMALYGHPYKTGSSTLQALLSAVDMQQASSAMATVLELMDLEPIEIGVGINTGEVLICEVGGEKYREQTVIGAPVNFAAKMEDIAGEGEIIMPESALKLVESESETAVKYFEKKEQDKYDVNLFSFNWINYLEADHRIAQGWET